MRPADLTDKLIRRASRFYSRYLPVNAKYKPKGIVDIFNGNNDGYFDVTVLNPPSTSTLEFAEDFISSWPPDLIPPLSTEWPGEYVVRIPNGRVLLDAGPNAAFIDANGRLLDQLSFQWKDKKVLDARDNIFFSQKGFIPPARYPGKVFSLISGGGAKTYYYHWVVDSMPRLHLLQRMGLFDQIDYFLVPNTHYRFQREFLEHFGIPKRKIIDGNDVHHIQADELIVTSYTVLHRHHPRWIVDWLFNSFIPPGKTTVPHRLVYISRGDASKHRKILNEKKLIAMLKKYGFEILFLTSLSLRDQALLFNSIKIVVGAHGGGFTNVVFCQPGAQMLEFFPDGYMHPCYYDLANKRGVRYDYLKCKTDLEPGEKRDDEMINMTVDVAEVEQKVITMLKNA